MPRTEEMGGWAKGKSAFISARSSGSEFMAWIS